MIDHRQATSSKAKTWLLFKVSSCPSCSLRMGWSHSADSIENVSPTVYFQFPLSLLWLEFHM